MQFRRVLNHKLYFVRTATVKVITPLTLKTSRCDILSYLLGPNAKPGSHPER